MLSDMSIKWKNQPKINHIGDCTPYSRSRLPLVNTCNIIINKELSHASITSREIRGTEPIKKGYNQYIFIRPAALPESASITTTAAKTPAATAAAWQSATTHPVKYSSFRHGGHRCTHLGLPGCSFRYRCSLCRNAITHSPACHRPPSHRSSSIKSWHSFIPPCLY